MSSPTNAEVLYTLDAPARRASLDKSVFFGYQGWFTTPQSADVEKWSHWSGGVTPDVHSATFDLFPHTADFPPSALDFDTEFTNQSCTDGTVKLPLYDSLEVVETHFDWMVRYGINGVAVQRFVSELSNPTLLKRRTDVLLRCISAAESRGLLLFVEYDISGANPDTWAQDVLDDWAYLTQQLNVHNSPSYQHHNDRPVLTVFGIGFTEHPGTPEESLAFIKAITTPDPPADNGVHFIGHVPTYWRDSDGDSQPGFEDVYAAMHTISPWLVGRYSNDAEFDNMYGNVFVADAELVHSRGQGYAPNVFPGFSWTNLQRNYGNPDECPLNQIPRQSGAFWEHQFASFAFEESDMQATPYLSPQFIFGAMFDEFDEGTAMAKAASTVDDLPAEAVPGAPEGGEFLYTSIDGEVIPSDFYLQLAGNYTAMFNNYNTSLWNGSTGQGHSTFGGVAAQSTKAAVQRFHRKWNEAKMRRLRAREAVST